MNSEAKRAKLDVASTYPNEAVETDPAGAAGDPFIAHYCTDRDGELLEHSASARCSSVGFEPRLLPSVGPVLVRNVSEDSLNITSLEQLYIKGTLAKHLRQTNIALRDGAAVSEEMPFTVLQKDLLSVICQYHDLFYARRTLMQTDEVHFLIALHSLNHVLKSRGRIQQHKNQATTSGRPSEHRDLGLARAKVLILVPFRHSAYLIVRAMMRLLFDDDKDSFITHRKRFLRNYGPPKVETKEEGHKSRRARQRPVDFQLLFQGNHDDCFRFGLATAKNSLKLFTDFYSSDMIIASPLGLRSAMGSRTEKHWDCDFLSSIEVLIMDQADVFLMQNWKHVIHVIENMHQLPVRDHGVDYSKVRMWCVNGLSKFYCQTILFSSVALPELQTLFMRHAFNYAGQVIAEPLNSCRNGCLGRIVIRLPQVFNRIDCAGAVEESEVRYRYFIQTTLPHYADVKKTLLFVPSYFDFVRLRNYLKREDWMFVHVNEYSDPKKVSRARSLFFHGEMPLLVITERFYFYHRYVIRGAANLLFYQLPTYPSFYAEFCNMVVERKPDEGSIDNPTCTVLYSKLDRFRLLPIVGADRMRQMFDSDAPSHLIVAGE